MTSREPWEMKTLGMGIGTKTGRPTTDALVKNISAKEVRAVKGANSRVGFAEAAQAPCKCLINRYKLDDTLQPVAEKLEKTT